MTWNRVFVVLAGLALTSSSQTAKADTAQINLYGTQSGSSSLLAPFGGRVSDLGEPVDQLAPIVNDVVGGPFSISGGALSFTTPRPTSEDSSLHPAYFNYYGVGGGTLTLTGSIFGLPDSTTLLTATFAPASHRPYGETTTAFADPTADLVDLGGALTVRWINPVLLADTGAAGFNHGVGSLTVIRSNLAGPGALDTSTSLVLLLSNTPEPPTILLVGTAVLALAARWWSRSGRRRTS